MKLPLLVLCHIPSTDRNIVGDTEGKLGIATDEFLSDFEGWEDGSKCVFSVRSNRLTVVKFHRSGNFVSIGANDDGGVVLERYIICDEYSLLCGFDARTKTWVVKEDSLLILSGVSGG